MQALGTYNASRVVAIATSYNFRRSPGQARGPAGCGHSKLARARTGLLLTSVQFISVTEVVTKKRNEIFFAKASEAEI